jgi:hypothetical protein
MAEYHILIDAFNKKNMVVYSIPGMPLRSNLQRFPEQKITLDAQSKNKSGVPYVSVLGTPVFSNIILLPKDESKELRIDAALTTLDMTKNIVKTPMVKLGGTVKEFIADGDWDIQIQGMLTNPNPNEMPDISLFKELIKKGEHLVVYSQYLQQYDIYNIVIENVKLPQKSGYVNTQFFDIKALSDIPVELKLNL